MNLANLTGVILAFGLLALFVLPIVFVITLIARDASKGRQMKVYWEKKWPEERTPIEKTLLRPSQIASQEELLRPARRGTEASNQLLLRPGDGDNTAISGIVRRDKQ